jgi:hypothetical protein
VKDSGCHWIFQHRRLRKTRATRPTTPGTGRSCADCPALRARGNTAESVGACGRRAGLRAPGVPTAPKRQHRVNRPQIRGMRQRWQSEGSQHPRQANRRTSAQPYGACRQTQAGFSPGSSPALIAKGKKRSHPPMITQNAVVGCLLSAMEKNKRSRESR